MSLIHAIARYVTEGDISLDPTRKSKTSIYYKVVRSIKVASYFILGVTLSPASIILGNGISIGFLAVSINNHVNLYLSNKQPNVFALILRSLCILLIETPCVAIVLICTFFIDIISYFLQLLVYESAEINNYTVASELLDDASSSIDKLFYKKPKLLTQ